MSCWFPHFPWLASDERNKAPLVAAGKADRLRIGPITGVLRIRAIPCHEDHRAEASTVHQIGQAPGLHVTVQVHVKVDNRQALGLGVLGNRNASRETDRYHSNND